MRGYRELKKREFRDTISQAFAGSGVVAAVQHEITAACLMLQRTFTDHILAALDNNLALLAEQHARSATRIDIELQRLVLMRATSEGLEQQARQWLAQLAALADAQPTDDSRRTAHESRETRDDNI